MDAATGLLYVGNGQYYDPATGRFLTRIVNPDSTNPYVPWNPIGAIVGPIGLISLLASRKKKGSKAGTFLVLLLVMMTVGMTLSACGGGGGNGESAPSYPTSSSNQPPVDTGPGTSSSSTTGTATPPITLTLPDCPTPIWTPTPTGTLMPKDITTMPFPGSPAYDEYGAWGKTTQKYKEIRDWMITNAPGDLEPIPDSSGYGLRFKDDVLLTIIVTIEFRSYSDQSSIFSDLLGALDNQYQSPIFCGGNCDTVEKQLVWLSNKQGIRAGVASVDWITRWYPMDRHWGAAVIRGDYTGRQGWEWGNYTQNSPFRKNPDKYQPVNFLHREDGNYAGIVVFTAEKNIACRAVNCLGW